jgi:phosphotransferase system enzyme I (PtsP)
MPPVGMMIEIPSVMETIDDFIGHADFFSVGTNDLVQYMLAADRTNERVAEYYCPHHPAVLRSLRRIVSRVVAADGDISICGEMAHDMRYIPFLIGIGVRKLSVDPHHLPDVQQLISRFSAPWAEEYAKGLTACKTVAETTARLRDLKLPAGNAAVD